MLHLSRSYWLSIKAASGCRCMTLRISAQLVACLVLSTIAADDSVDLTINRNAATNVVYDIEIKGQIATPAADDAECSVEVCRAVSVSQ